MTKQEETELRNVLVGSTRVSRRMIQILEKNDMVCTKGKTHYKLRRKDGKGYIYCFAATPSDIRAGMNSFKRILKLMEL